MLWLNIEALRQSLRLGCTAEERAFPQVVTMDISLRIGDPRAINTDAIKDTVDYIDVVRAVDRLAHEGSWRLLEKLCFDVLSEFFAAFVLVEAAEIRVRKNIVPNTEGISARVSLTREEWGRLRV